MKSNQPLNTAGLDLMPCPEEKSINRAELIAVNGTGLAAFVTPACAGRCRTEIRRASSRPEPTRERSAESAGSMWPPQYLAEHLTVCPSEFGDNE
jgi:hypothetical protein